MLALISCAIISFVDYWIIDRQYILEETNLFGSFLVCVIFFPLAIWHVSKLRESKAVIFYLEQFASTFDNVLTESHR